ncbi:hypothetical protein ACFXK0_05380 [Nocardia sp. NPDC059177]|uniref:hypothetical protein n=1 Tax=Nocardia sp. NPDC059177 TaxID=3346759 RepID=UPI0036746D52
MLPWTLTWDEVDPARHPFDTSAVAGTVRSLAPATAVPARASGTVEWDDEAGEQWADAMSQAVIERFGRWAVGWRWAVDEGDFGGGPVTSWCCVNDSLAEPETTLRRVSDAVLEWRDWLEDLADRFDRYPLEGLSTDDRIAMWERGSVHLINHVVARTGAGDAWYRHCAQVLTWFLTRWGVAESRADLLVHKAIGGRFDSWCEPAPTAVAKIAETLARSVAAKQSGYEHH